MRQTRDEKGSGERDPGAATSIHETQVRREWIDYNGHMNVAYYVLAFDEATDTFFDSLGLDAAYRAETGNSTFAVESHVTYQREVMEGDPLRIEAHLIDFDEKRLHFFHRMLHAEEGYLAATAEWLSLHIDLVARRVAPFPPAIRTRLAAALEARAGSAPPPELGRAIALGPRRA